VTLLDAGARSETDILHAAARGLRMGLACRPVAPFWVQVPGRALLILSEARREKDHDAYGLPTELPTRLGIG
jgi:hypothetical protein